MVKYIKMYLLSSNKQFGLLKVYYHNKKYDELAALAHSLKPQAEYMGISELKNKLQTIVDIVRASADKSNLKTLIHDVEELNMQASDELETELRLLDQQE